MSLDIARSIAFSGLSATQVQISVASSNIANADTKGYTEKTANQASSITSGVGTGVTVTGITSTVDKLLLKSLIGANSDLGSAGTINSYLTELAQLFGNTASSGSSTTGTSLANTLAALDRRCRRWRVRRAAPRCSRTRSARSMPSRRNCGRPRAASRSFAPMPTRTSPPRSTTSTRTSNRSPT